MPYMYDDFDSVLSNIRLGQNRSYKRRKEAMEQVIAIHEAYLAE